MKKITLLYFLVCSCLLAQNKRAMSFEDLFLITQVNSGRLSPKGDKLLFSSTTLSLEQNQKYTQLLIKDLHKKFSAYSVSEKRSELHSPGWHPSGNKICYIAEENGTAQIYQKELEKNSVTQLTNHIKPVKSYVWLGTDKLIFSAEDSLSDYEKKKNSENGGAYYYEENSKNICLWIQDLSTGKEKKLTSDNLSVSGFKISPDQKQLAFTAAPAPYSSYENRTEIFLIDLQTLAVRKLSSNNILERYLSWSPDGQELLFISDANEKLKPYYQESIFKLNISSGTVTDILPGFNYQVIEFHPDWKKNRIYFIANKGTTQQIFSVDLRSKTIVQHTNVKGVIKSLITYKDKILYQMTDPENPDDFYITDVKYWKQKRLTFSNPSTSRYKLGLYKNIFWKSIDGKEIEGIIIYPDNYDIRKKYLLIVQLHGGPNMSCQLSFGSHWSNYPAVLTGKDYVIFQPNYRGSTGYGDDYMRAIIGNFFSPGYNDIMSGVQFLIKNGVADENKLAVMGYSAGGHFTNWIITHTTKFSVASSGSGAADFLSFYAQNEVPYLREIWFNNSPYDNIQEWLTQSPISYVKNVKTPTYFYCGENDTRVPLAQSLEMWRGLKKYNVATKLFVLPKAGHDLADVKLQYAKMKNELEWIEKYIHGNSVLGNENLKPTQ